MPISFSQRVLTILLMLYLFVNFNSTSLFATTIINCSSDVGGTLSFGEQDTFSLTVNSNTEFWIRAHPAGASALQLQVFVYSPSGNLYAFFNAGADGLAELNILLPQSGTWTIVVSDLTGTISGNYGLSIQALNDPACAIAVGCNNDIFNNIGLPAQMWAYTAVLQQGELLRFRAFFNAVPPAFNGEVAIYDPMSNLTITLVQGATGLIDTTILIPATGNWLFIFYDEGGDDITTFAASFQVLNNAGCAVQADCSGDYLGNILLPSDMDSYTMSLQAGNVLRLRVFFSAPVTNFDGTIDIYDPAGNLIIATFTNSQGYIDTTIVIPSPGDWLFVLSDEGGENNSNFGVSFQLVDDPDCTEETASCEYEDIGGVILFGQLVSYNIDLNAGDVFRFRIYFPFGGFDGVVDIYTPAGALYQTLTANPDGLVEFPSFDVPVSGEWIFIISDAGGDDAGPFNLSFQQLNDPSANCAQQLSCDDNGEDFLDIVVFSSTMESYTFYGEAGDVVDISVENTPFFDSFHESVWLYHPDGTLITSDVVTSNSDDAAINGFILPVSGNYLIVACESEGNNGGPFVLTFNIQPDTTEVLTTTCDPSLVGIFTESLLNSGGCDSVVITTYELLPSDTTNINSTTCDPAASGIFSTVLTAVNGCDSLVVVTIALINTNLINLNATTCDPAGVGVTIQSLTNVGGCDSIVITTVTLLESDTTLIMANTCDPAAAGVSTQNLSNILGCDSLVISTITFVEADTTEFFSTTCDPAAAGVDTQLLMNVLGCDSLLISTITFVEADTTEFFSTSCDPAAAGVNTQQLTNILGCDSLVISIVTLVAADTTALFSTTCDPANAGTSTQMFTNILGCDSLVISTIVLVAADTTGIFLNTCDPAAAGTTLQTLLNVNGCDSLVFTTLTLVPSDTSALFLTTCDPAAAGVFEESYINVNGCDSIVFLIVSLTIESDTTLTFSSICDPAQVGIFTNNYLTVNGCDSIVIQTVTLTLADSTLISMTTCDPALAGVFTNLYMSINGCDSTVITTVLLEFSDTTLLTSSTCDPIAAGVFSQLLSNVAGCDSLILETVILLHSDTTLLQSTTCDSILAGSFTLVLNNLLGCDSIVINTNSYEPFSLSEMEEVYIDLGETYQLMPVFSSDPNSISWSPGTGLSCTDCIDPIAAPLESTNYQVTAIDDAGCIAQGDVLVVVDRQAKVFAPTLFSPNGDQHNDIFSIHCGNEVQAVRLLRLFDRWGELLYEGKDLPVDGSQGWDGNFKGKPVNDGVLVWYAEIALIDGRIENLYGDVTVVR